MPEPTPTSDEAMASVRIRGALGDRVLALEHVGSTSVAGLVAKPLLDVLLVVADPDEESAYVPDLVALGLALRIREPLWHRLLKGTDPALNLHVFAPDCAEPVRCCASATTCAVTPRTATSTSARRRGLRHSSGGARRTTPRPRATWSRRSWVGRSPSARDGCPRALDA